MNNWRQLVMKSHMLILYAPSLKWIRKIRATLSPNLFIVYVSYLEIFNTIGDYQPAGIRPVLLEYENNIHTIRNVKELSLKE